MGARARADVADWTAGRGGSAAHAAPPAGRERNVHHIWYWADRRRTARPVRPTALIPPQRNVPLYRLEASGILPVSTQTNGEPGTALRDRTPATAWRRCAARALCGTESIWTSLRSHNRCSTRRGALITSKVRPPYNPASSSWSSLRLQPLPAHSSTATWRCKTERGDEACLHLLGNAPPDVRRGRNAALDDSAGGVLCSTPGGTDGRRVGRGRDGTC